MTREELFSAIGEAEDAWVEAAGAPVRAAKKRRWPLAAAAALLALLVACGVQQGWFQFLTPDQWRGSAAPHMTFTSGGATKLGDDVVEKVIQRDGRKVAYQSRQLTEEVFVQQAAADGWALNWEAAEDFGTFSGAREPCWDAAQLQIETYGTSWRGFSGTQLETPYSLYGSWMQDNYNSTVSASFTLADGSQEQKIPVGESAEIIPLKVKGWNDAVFLDDALTFGKETYFVLAWKPLAKPVENVVVPDDGLEKEMPAPHTFDRCLLTVYFDGMDKEEALALAQALLQNA